MAQSQNASKISCATNTKVIEHDFSLEDLNEGNNAEESDMIEVFETTTYREYRVPSMCRVVDKEDVSIESIKTIKEYKAPSMKR